MSDDYFEYKFNQAVNEQLKGILTAKDLSNMVITLKIEFKGKKETEEEKEKREKEEAFHERKAKHSEFIRKWSSDAGNRSIRKRKGSVDNDGIKRERVELYEEYFPGEKEEDFLKK